VIIKILILILILLFYSNEIQLHFNSGMEITDAQKERDAILILRDAESRVNHSVMIFFSFITIQSFIII